MASAVTPEWHDWLTGGISGIFTRKKGPNLAAQAQVLENQRQEKTRRGQEEVDKQFAGFDSGFYNQRAQDYINYVMPQLGEQVREQQKNIVYGMADRGLSNSSISRNAMSGLAKQTKAQQEAIAEQGIVQAQELQRQVEMSRSDLYNQVLNASDPANAGRMAGAVAATYQQPSTFAPLVNTASGALGAYNQYKQMTMPMYGSGGYTPPSYSAPKLDNSYKSQKIN